MMPQPPVRDLRVSVYLCACPSASLFLAQISLGCCQSMPKPPSAKKPSAGERLLPDSLSLCLSVSLSRCLSVSLSRCLSVSLSLCASPPWVIPGSSHSLQPSRAWPRGHGERAAAVPRAGHAGWLSDCAPVLKVPTPVHH